VDHLEEEIHFSALSEEVGRRSRRLKTGGGARKDRRVVSKRSLFSSVEDGRPLQIQPK